MSQWILGFTVAGVVIVVTAIVGAAGYWLDKIAESHDLSEDN
jgi:hypothetical protein